jgi:hypothetical protein
MGDEEQHGGYIFSKEILSHQGAPHVRKPGELISFGPSFQSSMLLAGVVNM